VPDLDDERFESYLKQFRPLLPDALPVHEIRRIPRRRSALTTWAASGAVAVVILGVASLRTVNHRVGTEPKHSDSVQFRPPTRALTLREANALLATAPSYKAAMNELAFHTKSSVLPKDKKSALAVLGKEKIKL
jgi:hypothetical protein